jgi:hypothetical protein
MLDNKKFVVFAPKIRINYARQYAGVTASKWRPFFWLM